MNGPELHPDDQKILDKIIDNDIEYSRELREIVKGNDAEDDFDESGD